MLYGYARVSTTDQDLSIQESALRGAGCNVIWAEKLSGTSTNGTEELATLLQFIRKGDSLVDRLARSIGDLQDIVRTLKAKGATPEGQRTTHRCQHGSREGVPRHARVFAEFNCTEW
jgi:DNA invertase Pin-like site-specific DNA recombinase